MSWKTRETRVNGGGLMHPSSYSSSLVIYNNAPPLSAPSSIFLAPLLLASTPILRDRDEYLPAATLAVLLFVVACLSSNNLKFYRRLLMEVQSLTGKRFVSDCQLSVKHVNPRQYVAEIPQLTNLEVWFQRPKDIVRKLLSGDLDLGIVGFDTFSEFGLGNKDLIIVHDALGYGDCRLSIAIPKYGIFENINSLRELAQMPQWTSEKPLRVATGFNHLGPKFMKDNGFMHVTFSTADGALEAAPAMGIADAILDLVSSGTTLKENNLKEIEGGVVLESQAVLVARRESLIQREDVRGITKEILERFEAHLRAGGQFTVTANMRGSSPEEVAARVLSQPSLSGLQGPTVSPVFCKRDGKVAPDFYAIVICVPKKALYESVQQLREVSPAHKVGSCLCF
ncbi:hypothetical protein SADUNF_Sadunf19G0066600 [Salix dunnii]|uniref:ATP phosphoribosyltransferase n=1 Tax=Salix dunnii TaxID=1413687 RepID=A0A835MCJ7_9ROSI|nr:hypothetical protein SADUNF_Sadunf19G0066600 [Salix dunnii]